MTELKGLVELIPLPWQSQLWERLVRQHENGQLAHAYLAAGPSGLGKLAFLRQFARHLLCRHRKSDLPCGACRDCELSAKAGHPDIFLLQPEEGSRDIKVDQIRTLADFLIKSSHGGGARIAIIDHAHQMNISAANALLKSLEEPGGHSYIFLLSDAPGMLPATIRSRCQRLQFSVPGDAEASGWLHEHVDPSEDADRLLAAVDNRPLAALELSRTGTLDAERDLREKLLSLLAGGESLAAVTSAAIKLGELPAIECLLKTCTTLIKELVEGENEESDTGSTRATDLLLANNKIQTSKKMLATDLLQFHQQIMTAHRQMSAGSNPNPQLLIESLLWQFVSLSSNSS